MTGPSIDWRSPKEWRWYLPAGADHPVRELRGPLSYSEKKALSEFMERGAKREPDVWDRMSGRMDASKNG